jgi:hypothetical protein
MRTLIALAALACTPPDEAPADPTLDDNFGVTETEGVEGCDALLPECFYPFPSDAYIDDAGFVSVPSVALPENNQRIPFDTTALSQKRGFGAASPVSIRLPGAVLPADLVPFDMAPSMAEDGRTILLDAATGERIPHWVERDVRAAEETWTLRPAVPLPRGSEVVVGLRGFADASGAEWPAPEPFVALRDQEASTWLGIHARRAHFESTVFPTLEAAGWSRDALQLAWSFPVRSKEDATGTLLGVRDAVFAALPEDGPIVTVEQLLECDGFLPEGCSPEIAVILDGIVEVPSVVEPPDSLGVRTLRRDDDGGFVVDGVERWPFRLQLPRSAFEGDAPVPVMQYGHGFLGGADQANGGWLRQAADRLGFAILATDMQGMNTIAGVTWLAVLTQDGGRFPELADLGLQGVTNQLVQQRMVSTSLTLLDEPALRRDDGRLAWDPDTVWYYGNSQGGSVGSIVMGTSLDVQRGVLGVPGSGYPLLLHRSVVFDAFNDVLLGVYPQEDAISRFLVVLGTGWDDFDPLTFAPHIHGDPLPGTPDHEALLHVAKEDRQVLNEASFILGRAVGATLMTPTVRPVFGLGETPYPASPGAAVVEIDFGLPDDDTPLDPPNGDPTLPNFGDTHGWLRQWPPGQDQLVTFLRTGEVVDICGGEVCLGSPPGL